jgi:Flp pilus assembly protein TadD/thiol-disulfide isomerase/thioredoxin
MMLFFTLLQKAFPHCFFCRIAAMKLARVVLIAPLVLSLAASLPAQAPSSGGAARLRALFFMRDFETGALEGGKLMATSPDASELRAWYVLNLVRGGDEKQAVALAEEMTRKQPQDPWAWFALAGALNYQAERPADAVAAGETALKLLPNDPDIIWIHAQTLANDEKRRGEAIAFVDAQRGRVKNPAEILVTKGYALYRSASGPPRDEARTNLAFAVFAEARQIDPKNVNALYLHGAYLSGLRRSDEAYALLKQAVALVPGSTSVHQAYWNAVMGSRDLSADRKRQELEADVDAFLKGNSERPSALSAVAFLSRDMKWAEKQRECEDKILKVFPDSSEAEWIFAARWRDLGSTPESARLPQRRQILSDFIARPRHFIDGLLGEAYREYFWILADDKSVSGDELYRAAEGALKYETTNPHIVWVYTPTALADRKVHLADAERIARDGIEVLRKKIESQRSSYKSQGEYDRAVGWATAKGYDALGWVLFAESRADEAEKALLQSFELDHASRQNLDHLGRFYLARNEETRAEEFFVKGLSVQAPGVNPCETSLRSLYEKRLGSLDGIDAYLAKLREVDRDRRKERILAERIASPARLTNFDLKTLDGKRVSLDSLKGKLVVINFWGIWCGWCVQELPEYQKLYEKYASDPDVAILTIDNDTNPDDVPPWMTQKQYTFPVLIDDGYVNKAGLHAFPTTWFVDVQGRKVFEKIGWSEKLLEEFSWRIEAIRAK